MPVLLGVGCITLAYRDPTLPPPKPAPTLPSPNGFDTLIKATGQMVRSEDAGAALTGKKDGKPVTFTPAEKRAIVAANQTALSTMRSALKVAYREPAPPQYDIDRPFPHYAKFRALVRIACLDGQVRWDSGDHAGGADAFLDAVAVGRRVPIGAPIIGRLVGIACETIGRGQLWRRVEQMDATTARHVAARLNTLAQTGEPMAGTLEVERQYGHDALVKAFRSPKQTLGDPDEGEDANRKQNEERIANAFVTVTILRNGKSGILRNYDRVMDHYVVASRGPYARNCDDFPSTDPLSQMVVEDVVHGSWAKAVINDAFNNLLVLALVLRAYRVEKGAYPSDLKQLVSAGYLKALPFDPFSADGKTPPVYRRTRNGHYLLYSLGPDVKDDGGKAIENVSSTGKKTHIVRRESLGDIVAGVNGY